jgi:inorganic pyrophosphatase
LALQKGTRDVVDVVPEDKCAIQAVNDYLKYQEQIKKEIKDTISLFNLNKKKTRAI